MTLIAEDLLLLLLDDETGKLRASNADNALGGALLLELALAGLVDVRRDGALRTQRVHPTGEPPADLDPVLRAALETVADKPRGPQDVVRRLARGLRGQLLERLRERGMVERVGAPVLGVFPRTRWPAADRTHEATVRQALTVALADGTAPDERAGALAALLSALDHAHRVIRPEGIPPREVKRRAKELRKGTWAAEAVRATIDATSAAVVAVADTSSSSDGGS